MNLERLRSRLKVVTALAVTTVGAAGTASSQVSNKRPQLVVGIVIDGLDMDKINQLREHFGAEGFNRLLTKGVTITDLEYGSPLDETAATAVIYTGASPAVNGIPSAYVYDPAARRTVSVLNDPATIGNTTDETYSPEALRISTLTDELKIDTGGLGAAHTVSPDAEQAIIMGGHAGNSACWISDDTGKWASTTFYQEFPSAIKNINLRNPLAFRMDTVSWVPTLPPEAYTFLPVYKKAYGFRHSFPRNDPQRYVAFKSSAPVNHEVTSVAAEYIKAMSLGKHEPTDMINLSYTLQPYNYGKEADNRTEHIDSYLRLDRELARLFRAIDESGPGMDNTLVFVAGTPVNPSNQRDDEKYRVPSGDFSPAKAVSLLKVNLMSIYGNGDWVSGYHDRQIYLNRDLIKERGLDLGELRRESADFLRRMSGVTYASTIDEVIVATDDVDNPFPPARNIDIANAGDVFIAIAPGWRIYDEQNTANQIVVRSADSSSAAFILSPLAGHQTITVPTDARVIAPTVARLLRIRSPNGSQLRPLRF